MWIIWEDLHTGSIITEMAPIHTYYPNFVFLDEVHAFQNLNNFAMLLPEAIISYLEY